MWYNRLVEKGGDCLGTARTRANNKWNAKAYDRVNLIFKKDATPTKSEVQAAAEAAGESLNGYIVEAVKQRMERDKGAAPIQGTPAAQPGDTAKG